MQQLVIKHTILSHDKTIIARKVSFTTFFKDNLFVSTILLYNVQEYQISRTIIFAEIKRIRGKVREDMYENE